MVKIGTVDAGSVEWDRLLSLVFYESSILPYKIFLKFGIKSADSYLYWSGRLAIDTEGPTKFILK